MARPVTLRGISALRPASCAATSTTIQVSSSIAGRSAERKASVKRASRQCGSRYENSRAPHPGEYLVPACNEVLVGHASAKAMASRKIRVESPSALAPIRETGSR
jgi:hypothetical protein